MSLFLWDILYWVDCTKNLWTKFPHQNTIIETTVSHQLCKPCCNKLLYCFCPFVCAENFVNDWNIENNWRLLGEKMVIWGHQKECKGSGGYLRAWRQLKNFKMFQINFIWLFHPNEHRYLKIFIATLWYRLILGCQKLGIFRPQSQF